MRLDLDLDQAKAAPRKLAEHVRGSRLWPLVIVMLVAIVAVPLALSKSSTGTPVASVPVATPPPSQGTALPALNVESKPGRSHLPGHGRDPFPQKGSNQSSTGTTTTTGSGSGSSSTSNASGTGTTSGGATASGSGGSASPSSAAPQSTPSTPPSITPPSRRPAQPTVGLAPDQAYRVSLGITNAAGGVNTIDPLQRLTVLPSVQQPRLVELGVLSGGSRVLFAVEPGTVVGGPGRCIPGPVDCELLSLRPEQTEGISLRTSGGSVPVAQFAVTGVSAQKYSSVAAAARARRAESSDGRALLRSSKAGALSLFRYEPNVGAIVDLSSLSAKDGR